MFYEFIKIKEVTLQDSTLVLAVITRGPHVIVDCLYRYRTHVRYSKGAFPRFFASRYMVVMNTDTTRELYE